jgi:hypothetical protein
MIDKVEAMKVIREQRAINPGHVFESIRPMLAHGKTAVQAVGILKQSRPDMFLPDLEPVAPVNQLDKYLQKYGK